MSYAGYGMLATVGFIAIGTTVSAVNRSSNYAPAEATVFVIERQCDFTRTHSDGRTEKVTQSCNATDDFKKMRGGKGRALDIAGKAEVKLSYTAPQDGSYRTASLHFTGRDDEFYSLKADDKVKILVANENLDKIMLD